MDGASTAFWKRMRAGVASRTALGVALRRAAHQVLDRPLVFEDALALPIVDRLAELETFANQAPRTLRAFVAARSRLAEDQLAAFFAAGGRQYVVLGAGLDAYRNPFGPALQVIEIDHPETQTWKKERLRVAGITIPESLTFLSVDFEKQHLKGVLENAPRFDRARKTFFSWLGVTPYLTAEAMNATLQCIAGLPAGSCVVFDYAVAPSSLPFIDRVALNMLARRVEAAGEAFRLFLDPEALFALLRQMGFTHLQDLGQEEINARYFGGRSDGFQIHRRIGRIMVADNTESRSNMAVGEQHND